MEHNDSNLDPGIDAGPSPDAPAAGEVASPEVAHAHNTETDAGAPAGETADSADGGSAEGDAASTGPTGPKKRRRGSRGGKNRKKPGQRPSGEGADADDDSDDDQFDDDEFDDGDDDSDTGHDGFGHDGFGHDGSGHDGSGDDGDTDRNPELPERASEGKPSPEAAAAAVVRRPQIGDTRPAPAAAAPALRTCAPHTLHRAGRLPTTASHHGIRW